MLLLKPEVGDLRLAAAEIVCELLVLDFSSRCRVSPPYHSHAWYTPWSVFQDGPVGDVVGFFWQSLPTGAVKTFPSTPSAVFVCGADRSRRPPLLPRDSKSLDTTLPGVRSAFCSPKECQPSVAGPTIRCYDSASSWATSRASATRTSAASDYPPTTSDSTISSLLTLFSKFFSPFLRSTCSLSVSHKYLALEEVYLPFRAAVPNNPTLGGLCYGRPSLRMGLSPSLASCSKELTRGIRFSHAFALTL